MPSRRRGASLAPHPWSTKFGGRQGRKRQAEPATPCRARRKTSFFSAGSPGAANLGRRPNWQTNSFCRLGLVRPQTRRKAAARGRHCAGCATLTRSQQRALLRPATRNKHAGRAAPGRRPGAARGQPPPPPTPSRATGQGGRCAPRQRSGHPRGRRSHRRRGAKPEEQRDCIAGRSETKGDGWGSRRVNKGGASGRAAVGAGARPAPATPGTNC